MIYHIYIAKDRYDGYDSYFAVAADSSHFYVTAEFLAEDDWPDFEEHRHRLHQYKPDVSRMRWPELVRTTADLIDDEKVSIYEDDFYIDERSGCIAVRKRVDGDVSPGLHQDLPDVIAFWRGETYSDGEGMVRWRIHDWQREKAEKLCDELNG